MSRTFTRGLSRAALAVLLSGGVLHGFGTGVHRNITERGLAALAPAVRFSPMAVVEIQNANECTDTGPLLDAPGELGDAPCIPNLASARQQFTVPQEHFDNEEILLATARIAALKIRVAELAVEGRFVLARKLLGSALHSIQDFYSHSNWIELGKGGIFPNMEDARTLVRDASGEQEGKVYALRLSGKEEWVCEADDKSVLLPKASKGGWVLTSGYFARVEPERPAELLRPASGGFTVFTPDNKCAHGYTDNHGIDKDDNTTSHGEAYHRVAVFLATEHTKVWVASVLQKLRGNQKAIYGLINAMAKVDANAEYRTGVTVREGERYTFRTQPDGRIVWGYEGGFFKTGRVLTSGPEGVDASGLARTGLIPPPMRDRPVAALIGKVQPPPVCPAKGSPQPCIVPAPRYFYIGLGGEVPMPADGSLALTVNDAVLGNNEGFFLTEFTMSAKSPR